jgi:hypothetical protein
MVLNRPESGTAIGDESSVISPKVSIPSILADPGLVAGAEAASALGRARWPIGARWTRPEEVRSSESSLPHGGIYTRLSQNGGRLRVGEVPAPSL